MKSIRILWLLLLATVSVSLAQSPMRRGFTGDWRRMNGSGDNRRGMGPIENGILILEGAYISPPYQISADNDQLVINEIPLPEDKFVTDDSGPHWRGRFGGAYWRLATTLRNNDIVLSVPDQPVIFMRVGEPPSIDLLRVLAVPSKERTRSIPGILDQLPDHLDRVIWADWISGFVATDEYRDHVLPAVDAVLLRRAEHESTRAMISFTDRAAYPLSVIGMVLCVFAVGHLLQHRPTSSPSDADLVSTETQRKVLISLGLVATLSVFDLTWTLLASYSGQMRELNPIGSKLIEHPATLVSFKLGATFIAVGLLFVLRRHGRAQVASWWACLVVTLVTARWVVFNSLFVS